MRPWGALDMPEPGIDLVIEAARWGRHGLIRAAAGAGVWLGLDWSDAVTGETVNLLGVALASYVSLVELGLMDDAMRVEYVRTLVGLVDATGSGLALCPVPCPLAADVVGEVLEGWGFSVVGWR